MTGEATRTAPWRRTRRWLEPLVALVLFSIAGAILYREFHGYGLRGIAAALATIPARNIAASLGLTGLGYLVLTLYDHVGVRFAGARLPYRVVAPASFVSYAVSHNIGMAALTSGPIRYRFYSAAGLGTMEIVRVIVFVGVTFWLGVVALSGVAFVAMPLEIPPTLLFGSSSTRPLGLVLLLVTFGYLAAVMRSRPEIRIRSFSLPLPTLRIAGVQLVIASTDLILAAAALYVLLPPDAGVSFPAFVTIFLLSLIAGLLSQVPGGLGVFETVLLLLLPTPLPGPTVLATLVAFRIVYYVVPLFVAGGVLATYELSRRRRDPAPAAGPTRAWLTVLIPQVAGGIVFVAGVALLLSGAMPAVPGRLHAIGRLAPLAVVETTHLLGSVVGLCLLFLARGLQRRLDAAYHVTVALLVAGALLSLAKGLDYEEALVLGAVLCALVPMRAAFYRRSALLADRFTPGWLTAIAVAVGTSIWIGLLAHRHVGYSTELWWQFALRGEASRFMRASLLVAVVAGTFAFARLVGRTEPAPSAPDSKALERAAAIAARSPRTGANLAVLGDKRLLFAPDDAGFIMYAIEGRSWIAMGDPVGPFEVQRELVWRFRELVDRYDGWPVFYEVGADTLPLYVDLGLTMLRLGEEAIVPLESFTLDGGAMKGLRHTRRKLEAAGCTFSVIPADGVEPLLPRLRAVSDQWLAAKRTREKGFSLGFFDEAYLRRFPLGVATHDGAIVAFATVWPGIDSGELSVDLMRYSADAPPGVMDYLFVELMLWGRAAGYRTFNLGMAPLAGMTPSELAPLWNRLGAFLFRHAGELYNFEGLRNYKDKFDPRWEPRYLASPAGLALPRILTNLATLIGGGARGVFGK